MGQITMLQASRELDKLKEAVAARQAPNTDEVTDVQVARWVAFTLAKAARGLLSAKRMSEARNLHFTLHGTPEIDIKRYGPKHSGPVICIEGGKPNQMAPVYVGAPKWGK